MEEWQSQINSNITNITKSISALQEKDLIVSVTPLADGTGYSVVFEKAGEVKLLNGSDGEPGATPQISVKQDTDGLYYWTVDGEFLLVDGKKVPVTQNNIPPQLRINEETNNLEISYDGGQNWQIIGEVGKATEPVDIIVKDVYENEARTEVVIELTNGAKIVIPKVQKFALIISSSKIVIRGGESISVDYTVSAADDDTIVDGFGTNGFEVTVNNSSISSGTIMITAPDLITNGKVFVIAVNGQGITSAHIISFEEGVFTLSEVPAAIIPKEGGDIELKVNTNYTYTVNFEYSGEDSGWLTHKETVETKSVRSETIVFTVAANDGDSRTAELSLVSQEGHVLQSLLIAQDSGKEGYRNPIDDWEYDGTVKF